MSDPVNLRTLRVFTEVARLHSITRAAVGLGMAQSAVSRAVAELEQRFGGRLFLRTGRGVTPTDLAAALLTHAQGLLDGAEGLDEAAREQQGSPAGVVTLGLAPAVSAALGSALFEEVLQHLPRVRLQLLEGYSGEIEEWLAAGRIDIAVLNRYRARAQPGVRRLLVSDLMLIGRRGSLRRYLPRGAATAQSLSLRDIGRFPLVLPSRPNTLRSALDELSRHGDLTLQVEVEAGASGVIKRIIADHGRFSILPYHAVANELDRGVFEAVRIGDRGLRQSVVLLAGHRRPSTAAVRAVMQRIPPIAQRLIAAGVWRGDG